MAKFSTYLLQENNWVGCLCIRKPLQLRPDVVVALLIKSTQ